MTASTARPTALAASLPSRVLAQARFEAVSIMRNGEQLLLSIIIPVIALVTLSTTEMFSVLGVSGDDGATHVQLAVAGVLSLAITSTAFTGQAIATGFDRRYGVLKQLATTPLGIGGLIGGKFLAVVGVIVTQFVIIFGLGLVLGYTGGVHIVALVLAAGLGTAVMLTWALVLAGILRAEATLALANILWVLMAGLGGLLFAPSGMWGTLVGFTPSGALGSAIRAAVLEGALDWPSLLVLVVWTVAGLLIARRWFSFE